MRGTQRATIVESRLVMYLMIEQAHNLALTVEPTLRVVELVEDW